MFIVMTFSVFFFAEILMDRRGHPVQYLMIGFALTMFYILLTALAEHIGFDISYFISVTAIVALITGYSKAIMGGKAFTLSVFSALSLLYAYLYVILQLELAALEILKIIEKGERISPNLLIENILESKSSILKMKGLTVNLRIATDIEIIGDTFLIQQAFANLLQNAMDFSPSGSEIGVFSEVEEGFWC